MKVGELGLPAYRTFSLEELEEATNNFDTSAFMCEGSHGQVCILFYHIHETFDSSSFSLLSNLILT